MAVTVCRTGPSAGTPVDKESHVARMHQIRRLCLTVSPLPRIAANVHTEEQRPQRLHA